MSVKNIFQAVMDFDRAKTVNLIRAELDLGTDISTILNEGLIAPLDEVGKRFSEGALFLPEMLLAAQAVKSGVDVLRPLLTASDTKPKGTVVIGTVKGDMHDIGKNLVATMMEGAGFKVVDLGVDVDDEVFIKAIEENHSDIVALSALLTTTMQTMEETVAAIKKRYSDTLVLVGGAPVTQAFADRIGAAGYSADAPGAVETARRLINY